MLLAGVSTILGAILFLRLGYAVGHLGLLGALGMIALGHAVTIPTALALSEIATNRRVEGGGEYYVISRSFGLRFGGAIGASLYMSQALSVGFYCIALGEAFWPLAPHLERLSGIDYDVRMVSIPALLILGGAMLRGGAGAGVSMLYVVSAILGASLLSFFVGEPLEGAGDGLRWTSGVARPDSFMAVFAVCFPGFTGMTAGVGLSGDLKRPRRAIPLGTLGATAVGLVIYVAIVVKLAAHAPEQALIEDQLVMARMAAFGPLIPVGLACAALSSAIGSVLVAPRTLQALARDRALPLGPLNGLLGRGAPDTDEPRVGTVVTCAIALCAVVMGGVDAVARLISMFFMLTYGALCSISFLEHFAGNPSYRPSFRTRWYVSLFGAVICLLLMLQMDPLAAGVALVVMWLVYALARPDAGPEGRDGMGAMVRAAVNQAARRLTLWVQRSQHGSRGRYFRPSVIAVGEGEPNSHGELSLMSCLCEHHGFGTYIHRVDGFLDAETFESAQRLEGELLERASSEFPGVYTQTIVSPSTRSALAQALQLPGVSGMRNNTVLLSMSPSADAARVREVVEDCLLVLATRRNALVLRSAGRAFSERKEVHVWLTWNDAANVPLMLLLSYVLLAATPFRKAELHVFMALPSEEAPDGQRLMRGLLEAGRIPVAPAGLHVMALDDGEAYRRAVEQHSSKADVVLMGFAPERLRDHGAELLRRHGGISNVLFVASAAEVRID